MGGPLDFVKDLTAVMFITMLDDIDAGESKPIWEMLAKMKFKLYKKSKAKSRVALVEETLSPQSLTGDESQVTCNCFACCKGDVSPGAIELNDREKKFIEENGEKFSLLERFYKE